MKITLEYEVEIPDSINASEDEIEDWVRFEIGDNGSLNGKNPLINERLKPIFGSLCLTYD